MMSDVTHSQKLIESTSLLRELNREFEQENGSTAGLQALSATHCPYFTSLLTTAGEGLIFGFYATVSSLYVFHLSVH